MALIVDIVHWETSILEDFLFFLFALPSDDYCLFLAGHSNSIQSSRSAVVFKTLLVSQHWYVHV